MVAWFIHGALCHEALRRIVLGRELAGEPATLPDHALVLAEGAAFPVLVARRGARSPGLLLRGITADEAARLSHFYGPSRLLDVQLAGGVVSARVAGFGDGPGTPWDLEAWQALWGETAVATAQDIMALIGEHDGQAVRARLWSMLVRGSSRVRAEHAAPSSLRGRASGVEVAARRTPYANFFAVEEYDLSFRRFDGSMSPTVTRATFISGDAVTVLPYDPLRDRVLLVEQFRAGPYARGDVQPWQLEPIAGRVDPDESPETAARRESVEEAGLELGALLPVANYYPSPGAKTEFLYSYVALCDLLDGAAGVYGVEGEAEDIRGHLIAFDDLMALIDSGEAANAPLILTAFWLARERPRLRAAADPRLRA